MDTLQAAAKRFAQLVAPDIIRVTLHGPHGKVVSISIPQGGEPVVTAPVVAPPLPGWDFSGHPIRYSGQPIAIHGRKLDLLKVLAESPNPLKIADLKAAWKDYPPEDGTCRWFLGDLRRALKALFPDHAGDPIRNDAAGYWLTIR